MRGTTLPKFLSPSSGGGFGGCCNNNENGSLAVVCSGERRYSMRELVSMEASK